MRSFHVLHTGSFFSGQVTGQREHRHPAVEHRHHGPSPFCRLGGPATGVTLLAEVALLVAMSGFMACSMSGLSSVAHISCAREMSTQVRRAIGLQRTAGYPASRPVDSLARGSEQSPQYPHLAQPCAVLTLNLSDCSWDLRVIILMVCAGFFQAPSTPCSPTDREQSGH